MHHPTDRLVHTTAFCTPVVDDWQEHEIIQWISKRDLSNDPPHQ